MDCSKNLSNPTGTKQGGSSNLIGGKVLSYVQFKILVLIQNSTARISLAQADESHKVPTDEQAKDYLGCLAGTAWTQIEPLVVS